MVQIVPRAGRPAATRRRGRRAGHRDLRRQHASGRTAARNAGAGVLDRSAIAPIARGATAYERAVREASPASATPRRARPTREQVIASVEGVVGAVAVDSLVVEVGGIGYRVFAAPAVLATAQPGWPDQAPHLPPRPRGPAGAVRVPDDRGARLLQPAPDGDRRRAEGGPGDRRLAPDAGPPARDHGPGPGRPRLDPRDRQEAGRADHLRAQGEGRGRRDRRPARGRVRGRRRRRARSSARSRRSGYSLAEAREASRVALADVGVGGHARGPGQGRAAEPRSRLTDGRVPRADALEHLCEMALRMVEFGAMTDDPRGSSRPTCSTTPIACVEGALRPRTLDEYIGQREVKANLSVLLAGGRGAGERPPITSSSTARPGSARRPSRRSSPASSA